MEIFMGVQMWHQFKRKIVFPGNLYVGRTDPGLMV